MSVILITGTPGTGKTTASKLLSQRLSIPLVAVNDLVEEKHLYHGHDPEKGYKEVDMEDLCQELTIIIKNSPETGLIIEGHLVHFLENSNLIDCVVVLRARPDILRKRLLKRNWPESKVTENVEAEALDICTFEAVENHGNKVNEVDTTDLEVEDVMDLMVKIVKGKEHIPPGNVNFLEYLYKS
jgi:adenylate kinase